MFIIPILHYLVRQHIKWMRACSENLETDAFLEHRNADKNSDERFTNSMVKVVIGLFGARIPVLVMDLFYTELNNKYTVKIVDLLRKVEILLYHSVAF